MEVLLLRKQEQILSVIALVLLAGIILYHVLSSPLRYEVTVEEEVTTETVVATTTVSLSVTDASPTEAAPPAETPSEPVTEAPTAAPGIDSSGKVNLNTATLEDLKTLKGVGDSKAQAILDDRNENGPFSSIEDLTRVSGIGQKTFESLKDQITV
ncbi:MAG: helix-hairpin-helix domain-containing protein [Clostridia bacterium]|nr:helix-hairpin-helix domain-containing protein [Clostridia bacterium]MBQ8925212.1 helix-hairpin-helix domain-containing protein [Clostridia bacterium]